MTNVIHVTEEVLIKKLMKMTEAQLEHTIQLLKAEIPNYERVCANYSAEKMAKYGTPYLTRLHRRVELAEEQLERLVGYLEPPVYRGLGELE